jgi:predicted metalloenzyme YecM
MAKMLFKLAASELCGDICASEYLVNGWKMLVVMVHISKYSQWQLGIFDIFELGWPFFKSVQNI